MGMPMSDRQFGDSVHPLRMLACIRDSTTINMRRYTEYLADLLDGQLKYLPAEVETKTKSQLAAQQTRQEYDLIILGETEPSSSLLKSLLSLAFTCQSTGLTFPSLLITRQGNWPLRRILMVVRGEATDEATIEWGIRLARLSHSMVTVLVVLPPATDKESQGHLAMADMLTANTVPGKYIRKILRQIARWQIKGVLKLSLGPPEWQVRQEVSQLDYDLIIISAEPRGRLLRWRLESLIKPLLNWTRQPLLIARPTAQFVGRAAEVE